MRKRKDATIFVHLFRPAKGNAQNLKHKKLDIRTGRAVYLMRSVRFLYAYITALMLSSKTKEKKRNKTILLDDYTICFL